jgi:alpha-1,3-rhamnosyl/mannosyltransferase
MAIRVAVNQLSALGARTGIGHYAAQLVPALRQQAGEDHVDGFPCGWLERVRTLAGRCHLDLSGAGDSANGSRRGGPPTSAAVMLANDLRRYVRWGYNFLLKRHIRGLLTPGNYDLYHEPNIIAWPCEVPTVVTLHDLSVLLHPQWHPAARVTAWERNLGRTLAQSVHILADTEFVRQEVIRTLGVSPQRISRTYMGVRPHLRPLPEAEVEAGLRKLGLPPRYLLYLGTLEPRKNVLGLMRAYCSLPEPLRREYPLLLVGGWGWRTEDIAGYYQSEARHRGVLHLGYVAEENLPLLYNGARALAFPSHYEGFGLPPVEMLACGGAVLASKAGAVVETAGRGAHLIDADDADGWRDGLRRVLTDDDWWRQLRRGATEAAHPFTWERCAADTWRAYRIACGAPVPAVPRAA